MYVRGERKRERNVHERGDLRPLYCIALVSVSSRSSHILICPVMRCSFFAANTTTRDDYVESLQWLSTAYQQRTTLPPISLRLPLAFSPTTPLTPQRLSLRPFFVLCDLFLPSPRSLSSFSSISRRLHLVSRWTMGKT